MNELAKTALNTAFNRRPDLHVETEGEFAGWRTWTRDSFETHTGPFYHCMDENGRIACAFRVGPKHLMIEPDDPQAGPEPITLWALKDISFSVQKGEVLGVIGLCHALKAASRRMQRKSSEIVRLALREFLGASSPSGARHADRGRGLVGSLESGIPDLAETHRARILESLRRGR